VGFIQSLDVHPEAGEDRYLLDQRILGIAILFLLGILVIVKQVATGSILDEPKGNFLVQFVNIFNLFFLLGESLGGLEYENLTTTGRREGNRTKTSG